MEQAAPTVEVLVARAQDGDRAALETVIGAIRDRVYNLALRMLWHPADAEDATQEILVRVVTHLGSFRGESAFHTWVYRVAANYLLTTRKRRAEREELTFARFAEQLDAGLGPEVSDPATDVEQRLLVEEVKLGCTHGMLLCLDRDHRLAYILGEVFELASPQAAAILGIAPATYRKRLERARMRIQRFLSTHCGLADQANPCRCSRRVGRAIELARVDPERLRFAAHPRNRAIERPLREMEALHDAASILRSNPSYRAPDSVTAWLRELLDSGRLKIAAG